MYHLRLVGEVVWVCFKAVSLTNEWAVTKVICKRNFGTGKSSLEIEPVIFRTKGPDTNNEPTKKFILKVK